MNIPVNVKLVEGVAAKTNAVIDFLAMTSTRVKLSVQSITSKINAFRL